MRPDLSAGAEALAAQPGVLLFAAMAFFSTAHIFACSLPAPIFMRFIYLGQPAENGAIRWGLCGLTVVIAMVLYTMTNWLFPPAWAGNSVSLLLIDMTLALLTLGYEGG
jgi:hypothetical protein